MKKTASSEFLAKINYPPHAPTLDAALIGRPVTRGRWLTLPMNEEDALRLSRMCRFEMLLRSASQ